MFHGKLCLLLGTLQALTDILPIDGIPDGFDIVRTDVLVLQVVGMLPDVYTQQGD